MTPLYDPEAALAHLTEADPLLARLIDTVGPLRIQWHPVEDPFEALARAIIYQQLSGKAAATIFGRVVSLFPDGAFPHPRALLEVEEAALRGAGMSRAKVAAVRDLARKTLSGLVPTRKDLLEMPDDEIVSRLVQVRGIGVWTAEMLLFGMGRPDVFPVTDLGVRKGFMLTFGLDDLPAPSALRTHGERWRPFRSAASWYLWRAVDLAELRLKP